MVPLEVTPPVFDRVPYLNLGMTSGDGIGGGRRNLVNCVQGDFRAQEHRLTNPIGDMHIKGNGVPGGTGWWEKRVPILLK